MADASDADGSPDGPGVAREDAGRGAEPPAEPSEQQPVGAEGAGLDEDEEIPLWIEVVGAVGMYLAGGSLLLTVIGLGAISLSIEPFGRAATASSFVGLTVAMVLAVINHAYVADSFIAGR